jgi:ribosomal protein S18 acetylase RimI-like enzyme
MHKDMGRIAKALENGIDTSRFLVAEQAGSMIGIIACADCKGRAVLPCQKDFIKHLGILRGRIAYKITHDEFMWPIPYPAGTGYVEFVGVLEHARGRGIAKEMLREMVNSHPQYNEYILDVNDGNASAQKCYRDFGFVEFERVPVKYPKMLGYSAKLFMRYSK